MYQRKVGLPLFKKSAWEYTETRKIQKEAMP